MTFQEKLQFLMKITQTSNKELAANISVDPSLISLLRTGRRKMPQNHTHIQKMAAYFARHCSAEYQRQAIAEMLDMPILRSDIPVSRMEQAMYQWLCGESDPVSRLLNVLADVPVSPSDVTVPPVSMENLNLPKENSMPETQFFFGDNGRLEAFRQSLQLYTENVYSSEFLITSDESVDWLMDDYILRKDFMMKFLSALQRGMRIRQIMPSMNLLSRCVDSIRQWLPLYATGQVEAYYYPRLRDNLYSRGLVILPGVYAMVSTSIGPDYTEHITMLTTNPQLIEGLTREFYTLLSQCRPALKIFSDPDTASKCFRNILNKSGDIVQLVSPLSAQTAPSTLLEECINSTDNRALKETYQLYMDSGEFFENRLKTNTYVDLSRLPSAQDILTTEIPVVFPYMIMPNQPCYTPERYILHLRNILRLLDQYENYHFVPVDDESQYRFNLITAEGGTAILVKNTPPALFMEIDRPIIVQSCQEYLYRQAGQIGYKGIYREKIKSRIRTLIQELELLTK